MLSFGISNLNLGIFAGSLGEPSLRSWVVVIPQQALGMRLTVILINCF